MELNAWITLLIIAGTFITLICTKIKAEYVFFTAMTLLCLTGVLQFEETFQGFSSSSVLTVAVLYIVIAGLKHAGALEWIVSHIMGQPKNYCMALIRLMVPVGILSSFMSNTACTALFQDVVKIWAKRLNMAPSKFLIPLAYAASLGGLLTLIGTPPNLIISTLYAKRTGEVMNLLTPLPIGAAIMVSCFIVILLLRNFLPVRTPQEDPKSDSTIPDALEQVEKTHSWGRKTGPSKVFVSMGIMILMLVLSATGVCPLTSCCLGAGLLMVLTKCCTSDQAFDEVDWRVLIIFSGSVCLGEAIKVSNIDDMITEMLFRTAGTNPYVVLTIICAVAAITTEFLSDTGCAAMFFPIAWEAAQHLGVNPMPFVLALMMSVSSSYSTPIATPPNTIVYKSGGYRFSDYARLGIPMKIVSLLISVFLTTALYPF